MGGLVLSLHCDFTDNGCIKAICILFPNPERHKLALIGFTCCQDC